MENAAARVLKAENVQVNGSVRLDIGRPTQKQTSATGPAACSPQADIVEKTDAYAVIELTCACGAKTRIRCEYV